MGKRVDFSARTVITPDPSLALDELGVQVEHQGWHGLFKVAHIGPSLCRLHAVEEDVRDKVQQNLNSDQVCALGLFANSDVGDGVNDTA